jgi:hypothetical protein
MNTRCAIEVLGLIRSLHPSSVLAVTPNWREIKQALSDWTELDLRPIAGDDLREQLAQAGPCQLAVVTDTLESLPLPKGRALLAALRDVYSETCLVAIDADAGVRAGWNPEAFIAMGFKVRPGIEAWDFALYSFSLRDYKTTPDWLNARHWANPERWDKDRW